MRMSILGAIVAVSVMSPPLVAQMEEPAKEAAPMKAAASRKKGKWPLPSLPAALSVWCGN